jgi:hypothetical protein
MARTGSLTATMKQGCLLAFIAMFLFCITSCGGAKQSSVPATPQVVQVVFSAGAQNWVAGFADYPAGQETFFQLASGIQPLPAPLDQTKTGFFISGINHSDDLFMFLKSKVTGLKPNTIYQASFHVEFATSAAQGCPGVGGSPGEGVFVKAGASVAEPLAVLQSDGSLTMNVDKGQQGVGGKDAIVIGNVANSSTDCLNQVFQTKALDSSSAFSVQTDSTGSVWLMVGTDSGFEGTTSLYYQLVKVTFTP